jgi:hypothetical protein
MVLVFCELAGSVCRLSRCHAVALQLVLDFCP